MLRFLLTRFSLIIPTFIGMTLLAFFLIRLVPGDPIETMAGERGIDAARHEALLKEYGLDRPVLVQYGIYIGRVLHGDLGKSMITQSPVLTEFAALFPATIELALCAIVFALLVGIPAASSPRCAAIRCSTTA
jgi:dipeptide transport system permease protein